MSSPRFVPEFIGLLTDGTEPDGLSLEKLYRVAAPWEEQRRSLGVGVGR